MRKVQLTTERLLLREFRSTDHAAVQAYASDPEILTYADWGPNTPEDTTAFLAMVLAQGLALPRTDFQLAVTDLAGTLVGAVNLAVVSPEDRRGEIGWLVTRPEWGKGYATEAAGALLRFGFAELGLHKISATTDPENVASWRVMEKIGMVREGHLRGHRQIRGTWKDRLLYALVHPDS
jgi:ribosomal-protein-alanine N-acetyltransferase